MGLSDIFKMKPNKFVTLLSEQTSLTVKGLDMLKAYMEKQDRELGRQIVEIEKEADEVRRILIDELLRSFVTPFDREDIFALSREIDDILDYVKTTVDEMDILDISATPFMVRMTSLLFEAAVELHLAIQRLQTKHYNVANEHIQRAKALENRVETVYREALADLFRGAKEIKHVINMLKTREIYRHLSNAADREDLAANVIANIVMKMS